MTDPILVKLLLKPLASIFELEFLRLIPEPFTSGGVFDPFFGETGIRGPVPAPHWSTSLRATSSGIVRFDLTEGADLAPKNFFVGGLGVPEEVARERLEDTEGEGGKAGPPVCCRE